MAKTIREMVKNMYYPTLAEKAAYWNGANAVLEMLYHIAYKEDWITNPKDGVRRFFEIYKQLKSE